jgi:hypothetical protein
VSRIVAIRFPANAQRMIGTIPVIGVSIPHASVGIQ